jgi:hypothetical protein
MSRASDDFRGLRGCDYETYSVRIKRKALAQERESGYDISLRCARRQP